QIHAIEGCAVLEFGAPWCGHCQAAEPVIKNLLSDRKLPHIKIYDGKGKPLGRAFRVRLWPTLILLRDGEEVARAIRPVKPEDVQQLLMEIE
ncbi:MAG: thioredoxin family protein, partial [Ketobacteraceae bacterium]|nr:thioredoxin family protein [Ketobacteraceae bacterium]